MNLFPTLLDLPRRLQQPQVRDLAWTLLSPPLLQEAGWPQRHPLAGSTWVRAPEALATWLEDLDLDPAPLLRWLTKGNARRLGVYYERLWQFALEQAPGVQLLAANLAIREGGTTLGELDMLIADRDGVHHLELAVKLYLGLSDGNGRDPLQWLGPGRQDRLGLKLGHLRDHQLPMSNRPQSVAALATLGITDQQAQLWLGGYLFYPWAQTLAAPAGAHPQHLRGHWVRQRDWAAFADTVGAGSWQLLERQAWLAPARYEAAQCWSPAGFTAWRETLDERTRAQLVVRWIADEHGVGHEVQRVFVVPDGWGPGAPVDE